MANKHERLLNEVKRCLIADIEIKQRYLDELFSSISSIDIPKEYERIIMKQSSLSAFNRKLVALKWLLYHAPTAPPSNVIEAAK